MDTNEMLSTGEIEVILKKRYPNLESGWLMRWLTELNESIGWLRQKFSGNGLMSLPWSGGEPQKTKWAVPIHPPNEPKKKH